jgi:hypothetical protein
MSINFIDFWKFFDDRNAKHVNAVQELQKHIAPEQLIDSANWVKIYRTKWPEFVPPAGKSIAAKESERKPFNGKIDWNDKNCYISKYWTVAEVTQCDRRRCPVMGTQDERNIMSLAKELDKVREAWGKPLGCTSWYRPEPINSQVGGVWGSKHIQGLAADIYPLEGDTHELQNWLDSRWGDALGYGAWKGFIHLDIRNGGGLGKEAGRIRWNY